MGRSRQLKLPGEFHVGGSSHLGRNGPHAGRRVFQMLQVEQVLAPSADLQVICHLPPNASVEAHEWWRSSDRAGAIAHSEMSTTPGLPRCRVPGWSAIGMRTFRPPESGGRALSRRLAPPFGAEAPICQPRWEADFTGEPPPKMGFTAHRGTQAGGGGSAETRPPRCGGRGCRAGRSEVPRRPRPIWPRARRSSCPGEPLECWRAGPAGRIRRPRRDRAW